MCSTKHFNSCIAEFSSAIIYDSWNKIPRNSNNFEKTSLSLLCCKTINIISIVFNFCITLCLSTFWWFNFDQTRRSKLHTSLLNFHVQILPFDLSFNLTHNKFNTYTSFPGKYISNSSFKRLFAVWTISVMDVSFDLNSLVTASAFTKLFPIWTNSAYQ